ncbi:MAG: hypothetical protein LBV06_09285 [Propionibacteriaceae bacterium]|jgi:hypothetical protein|nr:hypothetical protein [Propionibacteriaceae bacterium]
MTGIDMGDGASRPSKQDRTRHVTLTVFATEALILFLLVETLLLGMAGASLRMPDLDAPFELILPIVVAFALGALIIIAALREVAYHILAGVVVVLLVALIVVARWDDPFTLTFSAGLIAPLGYYYVSRIWRGRRRGRVAVSE